MVALDRDLGRDTSPARPPRRHGRPQRPRDRRDLPPVRRGRGEPRVHVRRPQRRRRPALRTARRTRHPADVVRRRLAPCAVHRGVPWRNLSRARPRSRRLRPARRHRPVAASIGRHVKTTHTSRVVTLAPLMALTAGVLWSFGTVLARVADRSDAFQYLTWRSLGIIVIVEAWALLAGKPQSTLRAFTSGRRMMAANVALLLASIGFVYAVKTTSAANAAFLGATTPLFGVAVARVFLGERIFVRTYVAISMAFAGLAIMLLGDLHVGDFADNVVGDLAALASAAGFAFYAAIVRS